MWDFRFGKAVAMMVRTLPFVLLRMAVYAGIALAYLAIGGAGAGVGYGFGHVLTPDPEVGAVWGGVIGIALVSMGLYLAREYLLYLVKAAHIAVLVELYDGREIPSGQSQLAYGTGSVKTHFAESSVLFGVDQLVKAVLRTFFNTVNFFTSFLPVPALQSLVRMAEAVVRLSLTYIDEIILAYLIRTRTANPWGSAKDGLILYAQNYKHFLKNAVWLSVFLWLTSAAIFLVLLIPAGALVAFVPGNATIFVFVVALVLAWGLKAALLEPVAIAALMEVYFKTIEGQVPDPEWDRRLSEVSKKFRDLTGRAGDWVAPGAKPV